MKHRSATGFNVFFSTCLNLSAGEASVCHGDSFCGLGGAAVAHKLDPRFPCLVDWIFSIFSMTSMYSHRISSNPVDLQKNPPTERFRTGAPREKSHGGPKGPFLGHFGKSGFPEGEKR